METKLPEAAWIKRTRTRVIRTIERLFGTRRMQGISLNMVKIGLRGLGVKLYYDLENGAEGWFLETLLGALTAPVCADVGANIGEYTLLCRKFGASSVLAFEPSPETFAKLVDNTKSDPAITCERTALGERNGSTAFFVPDPAINSGLASRDIEITDIPADRNEKIVVPLTTLDDIVQRENVKLDLVKIDVEGFELEVLQGARTVLTEMRPVVQFEFAPHHMKRRQNMLDFARMLDRYALYRLSTSSLVPLDPGDYLANLFAYQNIIAIPEEMRSIRALFD